MKYSDRSSWCLSKLAVVAALLVAATLTLTPQRARAQACLGDCDGNGEVAVTELIVMVNIALGTVPCCTTCAAADPNNTGEVLVTQIVAAVNNALNGCLPPPTPGCGNGVVDAGEDCDNGGTCIGGTNAGTHCTAESACQGDGVCLDGPRAEFGCSTNTDCTGSTCIHCKPFGGATCAANCTTESVVHVTLVPGDSPDNTSITPGTSGLVVNSPTLNVGIPFAANTTRQLTIGKPKDGKVPVVLKGADNQTAGIDVLAGAACICLRPVEFMTCGGTVWEKSGVPSTDCSEGYTAGSSLCAGAKPCTLVYGAGNVGTGQVGCDTLNGVNVTATQNSGGTSGTAGPVETIVSDMGGAGSAVVYVATELGFTINPCTGTTPEYGTDQQFCTLDDPKAGRQVLPQVLTTGSATATVLNANGEDNNSIGPFTLQGAPLSCSALASGSASGAAFVGAFPDLGAPTVGDIVVTGVQVAQ
jgi:hypothetical protein